MAIGMARRRLGREKHRRPKAREAMEGEERIVRAVLTWNKKRTKWAVDSGRPPISAVDSPSEECEGRSVSDERGDV
jgi:hypothetical protein